MPDVHSAIVSPSPAPPAAADLELIAALRQDLTEADFTHHGVAQLLGDEAVAALDREQLVPGQLRVLDVLDCLQPPRANLPEVPAEGVQATQQQWKCAVLTALWLVALPVTTQQVDAALPRTRVEGLETLKLAHSGSTEVSVASSHRNSLGESEVPDHRYSSDPGETRIEPRADLRPYQVEGSSGIRDMWVTSDLSAHQVDGALPHDHVLGVGQASLTLAGITHRREVLTALDIGTGCGIQLLHLLDHAEQVVGTDLSERALEFARFNLLLNAPALCLNPEHLEERVELLQGSLLEPVQGRGFDLVVSNPPFVITPRRPEETEAERYVYRDGGREGDALMQELIAGLPEVLNPGGTAQMLGNWERKSGAAWESRPRTWSEAAGLSAWFIQRDVQTPAEYAETWLRDASEERSPQQYRRRYAEYLADFASRGVQQIGFGLIWLQKPPAGSTAHLRFEELLGEVQQPLGPVIGQTVQRALETATTAEAVLGQNLTVPDTVTEERYQRFGAEHPEVIIARQGAGLRRSRPVSSAAAGFLAAADGDFTAAQLITAVCSLTDTEEDVLTQEVLDLYTEGFLGW
ncbi:DUF7059 domain-containing protein [Nesterenkonia muleiensis]|uniref:DUF7059 domain-containing protein n=1 Tax=Nesterenkonia muleiensis TaxID=2282648 RepID=UPI000E772D13|nr:methyltransferase [Nesterenkonia muleiensis]